MARSDRMRLGSFLYPDGHHVAAWRHPSSDADAGINAAHYRQLAPAAGGLELHPADHSRFSQDHRHRMDRAWPDPRGAGHDGRGKSWHEAALQEPVLNRALTRFRLPWA